MGRFFTSLVSSQIQRSIRRSGVVASAVAAAAMMASMQPASGAIYNWTNTALVTTNWGTATNWDTDPTVPVPVATDTVNFTTALAGAETISIFNTGDPGAAQKTLGILNIGATSGTFKYTLQTGTAAGSLKLDNGGAGAQINQVSTSNGDTISAALALADNLTVNNASANQLTLSGAITGTGSRSITNAGSGTGAVLLSGVINNTVTGGIIQDSLTSQLIVQASDSFTGGVFIKQGTYQYLLNGTSGFGNSANVVTLGDASRNANATLLLAGSFTFAANPITVTAVSSGTLTINGNSQNNGLSGAITLNNALTIQELLNTKVLTLSGQITGSSLITIGSSNVGVVSLTNASNSGSFSGGLRINSGTLSFTTNALGSGNVTFGGATGTLQWGASTTQDIGTKIQALTGTTVATLDVGANAVTLASADALTGAGTSGFTKLATTSLGVLTLSNSNSFGGTYTAATTGGATLLMHTNALQNATVNLLTGITNGGIRFDTSVTANSRLFTVGSLAGVGILSLQDNAGVPNAITLGIGGSQSTTYTGIASGPGSLLKSGAGTLTLGGLSTFSGGVVINNGVVLANVVGTAATNGPLGIGATTVNAGGELRANVGSSLLGSSSINLAGGILRGNNGAAIDYKGNISVSADSTVINDRSSSGASVNITYGTLAIGTNTLNVTSDTDYTAGATATLTFGTTTLSGNPTFNVTNNGAVTPNITALVLGGIDNGGTTRGITLTGNGSLALGTLSNTGGFTFTVSSPLGISLGAANTYSGVTTINGGLVNASVLANVNVNSSIGTGSVSGSPTDLVFGNGTLRYVGTTVATTDRQFTIGNASGNGAAIENNAATAANTVTFSNASDITFGTTAPHTLTFGGTQGATTTTNLNIFQGRIIDQDATNKTSVVKNGTTFWSLNAAGGNTYTGGTTVNAGGLRAPNATALGTGLVTVNNGGQVFLDATASFANNFTITGPGTSNNFGAIVMGNGVTIANTSTITLVGGGRIGSQAGSNPLGFVNVNARITGTGPLMIGNNADNQGSLTWGNVLNDYTGDTTFASSNGTDSASSSGSSASYNWNASEIVPDLSNVTVSAGTRSSGTVALLGFNETFGSLTSAGNTAYVNRVVQNGSNSTVSTLTIGNGDGGGNFVGQIRNGGTAKLNLVKVGSGNQTLSGAMTYTGTTTISGGTLTVDFNQVATSGTNTPSNYLAATTDLTMAGGTTLGFVGRADATFTGTVATTAQGRVFTLAITSVAGMAVGQRVDGVGAVNIPANTYIQKIDVGTNTLFLSASPTVTTTGTATTLSLTAAAGSDSQTFNSMTLTGSAAIQADGTPLTLSSTSGTIGATGASRTLTLQGGGAGNLTPNITNGASNVTSVTKAGAGTWSLTNAANAYTGTTTVTGGILKLVAADNNIAGSASIIVGDTLANNAAKLDVTGVTNGFVLGGTQSLGGHGTVVGDVTTSSGAAIAPGNSIGTTTYQNNLSLVDGTVLKYDLDAPGNSDRAAVLGTLNLSTNPGSLHVNFADMGAMGEGTYTLFTYGTLTGGNGTFTDTFVVDSSPLNATYLFTNTGATNGQIDVTITAAPVPEPASLAVLGMGGLALLARRRRQV